MDVGAYGYACVIRVALALAVNTRQEKKMSKKKGTEETFDKKRTLK